MSDDLLKEPYWEPFSWLGLGPLWHVNSTTVINTWYIILFLLIFTVPVRRILTQKNSSLRFIIMHVVASFIDLSTQILGSFFFNHVCFVGALFVFIALGNSIAIIPWAEEPTRDLNTTLALGIITFIYTQTYALRVQGIKKYLEEFTHPFFLMFPLHVIGKLATVISISFRLFGNIFGGSIITHISYSVIRGSFIYELLGLLSGFNLIINLFFGVFESLLQAFVFTILSLTYLSIAIQKDHEPTHNEALS